MPSIAQPSASVSAGASAQARGPGPREFARIPAHLCVLEGELCSQLAHELGRRHAIARTTLVAADLRELLQFAQAATQDRVARDLAMCKSRHGVTHAGARAIPE